MKIFAIIGARPQFIKHAPVEMAFQKKGINLHTIHTGQHYDEMMSKVFFDELGMQRPFASLEVGSHSHGKQTGMMMAAIEEIFTHENPEGVIVYGDTNSTLAGALVASKLQIPVFHIEAGLRSFNKEMPEEINRVLTDHISDLLLVPTQEGLDNLAREGIIHGVHVTGDVMVDSFKLAESFISQSPNKVIDNPFYLATIHRPYNTDEESRLKYVLHNLNQLDKQVVFPMHPRTKNIAAKFGIDLNDFNNVEVIAPIGFIQSMEYLHGCDGLITDSGGMQKEAYLAQKICVTIRKETEWVETVHSQWNQLLFEDLSGLQAVINRKKPDQHPDFYGDGNASHRIAELVINHLEKNAN